jgi:hypothetical protein
LCRPPLLNEKEEEEEEDHTRARNTTLAHIQLKQQQHRVRIAKARRPGGHPRQFPLFVAPLSLVAPATSNAIIAKDFIFPSVNKFFGSVATSGEFSDFWSCGDLVAPPRCHWAE